MESLTREKQIYSASIRGDIESLNNLLKEDNFVLDDYGSSMGVCFNGTPMHIAATRGHVHFAKVLLQHKPDLVYELDSRLRSPLHLASAYGRVEMVKLLLDADSDVCLNEDEFGRTPLHLAAMVNGRVEVVNELVRARPESIMYPLNRTKTVTILHSYVLRNGPKALEQLAEGDNTFLNSQDGEGNTLLHKVVALKKMEMLEYLMSKGQLVDVNLKNHNSFTALDLIDQMPRDSGTAKMRQLLVKYGAINTENGKLSPDTNYESWFDKKRNAILVAATVIAGMAYQAGLSPPGGVWDENKESYITAEGKNITVVAGTSIMSANYPDLYIYFWTFNTGSFIAALSIVVLLIRGSPRFSRTTRFQVFLRKLYMCFLTCVLWVTATTMALSYTVVLLAITPDSKGFEFQWDHTTDIVAVAILAWCGLVCIIFLIYACRYFIGTTVKLVKCIKRRRPSRNANEDELQQNSNNDTTTTTCLSV